MVELYQAGWGEAAEFGASPEIVDHSFQATRGLAAGYGRLLDE